MPADLRFYHGYFFSFFRQIAAELTELNSTMLRNSTMPRRFRLLKLPWSCEVIEKRWLLGPRFVGGGIPQISDMHFQIALPSWYDLDFNRITLILNLDVNVLNTYLCTKHNVSMSKLWKVRARTGQRDRQTRHTQTDATERIISQHSRVIITAGYKTMQQLLILLLLPFPMSSYVVLDSGNILSMFTDMNCLPPGNAEIAGPLALVNQ